MEKLSGEDIRNSLKEKFNGEPLKRLEQFVEENQRLLGEYISVPTVIDRLKKNVDSFEEVEELINGKLDGQYDDINKKVLIFKGAKFDPNYIGFILFHELQHANTIKVSPNGEKMMGFSFLNHPYGKGKGLNEAFTEYLTMQRNEMLNLKYASGYDVIVDQMKILVKIIGKEKILHYYFYEPENFPNFLKEHNMDFTKIDRIYQMLTYYRTEIYALANLKKLDKVEDYILYKECQELFDMYSNAIGNIDTIEDFRRKYQILCSYKDSTYNINNIISCHFYSAIYNDAYKLIKKGYKPQEIEEIIQSLGLSIKSINQSKKYSEILAKDKNTAIIQLYQAGIQDQRGYMEFAYNNYSRIYEKFSEDNFIPDPNCLYDIDRYIIVGGFLSQHREYDFDSISLYQLKLSNNVSVYIIKPTNGKSFIYTLPFSRTEKISEDSFGISSETGNILITIDKEGISINSKEGIYIDSGYFKESQLESFCFKMNDTSLSEDERSFFQKKYYGTLKKIEDRKNETYEISED